MCGERIEIAPGSAGAVSLKSGTRVRIINTYGGQVVDTWAFASADTHEHLSMEHSRSATYRLLFQPGDTLVSNRFRPLFTITADTSPGIHDTLHAACSPGSNRFYGQPISHPNCETNLKTLMQSRGTPLNNIPCPWNLFEHAIVVDGNPSVVGNISGNSPRGAAVEVLNSVR